MKELWDEYMTKFHMSKESVEGDGQWNFYVKQREESGIRDMGELFIP